MAYVNKSPDKDGKTNTSVCLSYFAVLIKQGEQETVSEIFGECCSRPPKTGKRSKETETGQQHYSTRPAW